ncbi:hypothetical protein B0A58_01025 [Flavobacterium branchiophilum NBRC 15030 = ATCC 35035]|uniref:Uncharacterized protein n=2 Tax=Flavobacterium branchiophilum TaxID=55197 RepID=A0A543G876_9FLAO|nr:hypothetical protein B0A58_01025 [Flavobacterium branchiophilum NBRC 15030 = ATCC 35035]TQM42283.1 hypothetical protein BC670_3330 [Flavobacterium branchiophilum]
MNLIHKTNNTFILYPIYFLFFFLHHLAISQVKKNNYPNFDENANCIKKRHIKFDDRKKIFPYNMAVEILIVSFQNKNKNEFVGKEMINYFNSIKVAQEIINENDFLELKYLTSKQIEALTDVIFNYGYQSKFYSIEDMKCYNPRNAILFLDKNKIIIGYIEICFSCKHLRSSNVNINFGTYCKQKFDIIKKIFEESGIKYGITEEE